MHAQDKSITAEGDRRTARTWDPGHQPDAEKGVAAHAHYQDGRQPDAADTADAADVAVEAGQALVQDVEAASAWTAEVPDDVVQRAGDQGTPPAGVPPGLGAEHTAALAGHRMQAMLDGTEAALGCAAIAEDAEDTPGAVVAVGHGQADIAQAAESGQVPLAGPAEGRLGGSSDSLGVVQVSCDPVPVRDMQSASRWRDAQSANARGEGKLG